MRGAGCGSDQHCALHDYAHGSGLLPLLTCDRTVLYCPRLPAEYATWMGDILTPQQFKEMYEVCHARHTMASPTLGLTHLDAFHRSTR